MPQGGSQRLCSFTVSALASASRFLAGVSTLFALMVDSKLQAQPRFPPKVLLGSFSTTAAKQIREN